MVQKNRQPQLFGDVQVAGEMLVNQLTVNGLGRSLFVDAARSASGDGRTWRDAFSTMEEAFANLQSGDRVYFVGKVREQLEAPAGVFDVKIIGGSNRPRHADNHSEPGGGSRGSSWLAPASPTAATPLLKLNQQGWKLANFLMGAPADAAAVQLFRNADETPPEDERDASHAELCGMRFQGGLFGVESAGGAFNVLIDGCTFMYFVNDGDTAIGSSSTAVALPLGWTIRGSRFFNNDQDIVLPLSNGLIDGNQFFKVGPTVTNDVAVDLTDGQNNLVANNLLGSDSTDDDNVTRFVGASGDIWGPNHHGDGVVYGVPIDSDA